MICVILFNIKMYNSHQKHGVVTPDLFWHAVNILVNKPHVVNKRLWGCKLLGHYVCKAFEKSWEISTLPEKLENRDCVHVFLCGLIKQMKVELIPHKANENDMLEPEIVLMELLPRSYGDKHAFQLIFLQKRESAATFYDVTPTEHNQNVCPNFSYRFYLKDDTVQLAADVDKTCKTYTWLETAVLPQVTKWSQQAKNDTQQTINKSLALVPHDLYYIRYNDLKEKYGKELVKIWPECTDPSKFVYEDIAIATYLLLLFEEKQDDCEPITPQSFVDMGCGNGLLVYILTMEGHRGHGIDVRKRKIWDMYPRNVKLIEMTITPSNIHTFSEVDWIIGNHSDELTPWIPVIAARSSFTCKFFLLPCCAYNFDGTKYQRQNSSKSQYTEYLEYIHKLSEECGFQIYTDRLKIPSTKRICFVGKKRNHLQEEFSKYCESIENLIKSSTCPSFTKNNETINENFKAREPIEKVRNCTQVDKKVVDSIISFVVEYLLKGCKENVSWSPGKLVDISEIVPLLPLDTLKVLKAECGGLQTLFKNNNQIFKVRNGKIQLQYPKTIEEVNKTTKNKKNKSNVKLKVKDCWFYKNHPQGCPLKATECSFLH